MSGKFFRKGHTNESARAQARKKFPDPPMITFLIDTGEPLISPTGSYGHAGYRNLFDQLVAASGRKLVKRVKNVRNVGDDWSLPAPSPSDITAIFGSDAVPLYWHYRQTHGLDY